MCMSWLNSSQSGALESIVVTMNPCLALIISFQSVPSCAHLHSHFTSKLLLCVAKSLIPRSPYSLGIVHLDHLTRWTLWRLFPCHKKSLLILCNCFTISFGIGNDDIRYVGMLSSVLLISVSLPPIQRYCNCHEVSFLSNSQPLHSRSFQLWILHLVVGPNRRLG